MNAYARTVSTTQERIDRRHKMRDWQHDAALASGLKTKIMDVIEEAQVLRDRRAFCCAGANDALGDLIDYLDDMLADCIKPMESAIAATEPGEGPDACPGMPRVM